jgi:uncharacterized protein (DUF58 family)
VSDPDDVAEVVRQVLRLRVRVLRRVRTTLAGRYTSCFHGPGTEFSGVTPYQPGEDARRIDWRVTARRRDPYTRRHVAERELRVVVLFDVSRSMDLSWAGPPPRRRALVLTAALAFCAAGSADQVAGIFFADDIVAMVPHGRGERHAAAVLRHGLALRGSGTSTDLRPALARLLKLRRNSVAVLVSDFRVIPPVWDPGVRSLLSACSRRHDVLAAHVVSPGAAEAPAGFAWRVCDPESGRPSWAFPCTGRGGGSPGDSVTHREGVIETLGSCGACATRVEHADDPLDALRGLLTRPHGAALRRRTYTSRSLHETSIGSSCGWPRRDAATPRSPD